jgi:cytochrome c oxidase assembly protein subunit 15
MTLSEFKTIFWWEWGHRLLGRTIGAVFLLPFLYFLWRGYVGRELRWPLFGLFALGAIQGAVGWWMVSSGLSERVSVSQYRLAFHMTLACVIYAAIIWIVARMKPSQSIAVPPRLRVSAIIIVALVLLQVYLGALVAGLDAGLVYNTWPHMDGALIPSAERLWFETPLWRNFFENALTVQFNHRMLAYIILLFALWFSWDMNRSVQDRTTRAYAVLFALLIVIQAMVGIATLLLAVPIGLALTHQAMAILLLTVAVLQAANLISRSERIAVLSRA